MDSTAGSAGPGPIVIIGGGMAGGNAAVSLRQEGYTGRVTLISREPDIPFGRPPLSKTYLRGEEDLQDWYVRPASWYDEHDIDRPGHANAVSIDAAAHTVLLGSGQEVAYRKLLIATGGRNRLLKIPSAGLPGLHYLRTVAESEAIQREARPDQHAVIVGMGFIGPEVAASLTPARGSGDCPLPREGSAAEGPRSAGRCGVQRHPPREGCRTAGRGADCRLRGN